MKSEERSQETVNTVNMDQTKKELRRRNLNYKLFANQVIAEIRSARLDPAKYAEKVEKFRDTYFRKKKEGENEGDEDFIIKKPRENWIKTNEGKKGFNDAIEFLKNLKEKVNDIIPDERLINACNDHVNDIGPSGSVNHLSSKQEDVYNRIERYGEWDNTCCEVIDFGATSPEEVVINLIVDDGNQGKPQRANLFSNEWRYVGVATGEHKVYAITTVINFASKLRRFDEKFEKIDYIDEQIKRYKEATSQYDTQIANLVKKKIEETKKVNEKTEQGEREKIQQSVAEIDKEIVTLQQKKQEYSKQKHGDLDRPENAQEGDSLTEKLTKIIDNREVFILRKKYLLKDGTTHIVDIIQQ